MITVVGWSRYVGLVGVALALSGCAKLNAAFVEGGDSETDGRPDSSSDSDPSNGSDPIPDPTPTSTGRPDPTTGVTHGDDSEGTTGYGTTGTSSGGVADSGSDDSSGDETSATTGMALPPWSGDCILEAGSTGGICLPTFSLDTMGTCGLASYSVNPSCGISPTTSFFLEVPAGEYVMGAFDLPAPAYSTGTPTSDPFECVQGIVGFSPDTQGDVLIEVRDMMAGEVDFYVREISTLCTVPPDCCEPSSNGVADACGDPGVASCVASVLEGCETSYEPRCVQAAVLACGAFCPGQWD